MLFHPSHIGFTETNDINWYRHGVFWFCAYRKTKDSTDVIWQLSVGPTILLEFPHDDTTMAKFFTLFEATKPLVNMLSIVRKEDIEAFLNHIGTYYRNFKIDQLLCTQS